MQGQPDPGKSPAFVHWYNRERLTDRHTGKEVPWKFNELLKNSTKYLEDHASLKAAEHASHPCG
jgi:hypothetical protein